MEIIIPVVIFILVFIACSVCGYCCKRNKQGIVYGTAVEGPVTTTTTTSYQTGNLPFPVMNTPMPQPVVAPPAGFAPHAAYPPTTPYPATTAAPYPPAGYPGTAPYPTTMPMPGAYTSPAPPYPATSAAQQLPPSYDEAVQNRTAGANINEGYSQQSPYNPSYN